MWRKIVDVALMDVNTIVQGGIDQDAVERLERVLLEADFGVDATMELVEQLERAAERGKIRDEEELRAFLGDRIREILTGPARARVDSHGAPDSADTAAGASAVSDSADPAADAADIPDPDDSAAGASAADEAAGGAGGGVRSWLQGLGRGGDPGKREGTARRAPPPLRRAANGLSVALVVGVNGTGKTTTVAKLAWQLRQAGEKVLLAATDTFRAGAQEQLRLWAERVDAGFVGGQPGGDPAAVAFDAIEAALTRGADWILVDTAGRLHTQHGLMEELRKIDRVVARKVEGAPHERLLVVDATSGQNVLAQAAQFGEALELTGLVLAKFDSTARAGTAVAVAREFAIPVRFLGTGEDVADLEPFDPDVYLEKVLGVA